MWQQMSVVCLVQTLQLLMLIPPVGRISMRMTNLVVNPAVNRIQDLKGSWPRVFERRRVALFAVRNDIYLLLAARTHSFGFALNEVKGKRGVFILSFQPTDVGQLPPFMKPYLGLTPFGAWEP
jgi:hypothetical protein